MNSLRRFYSKFVYNPMTLNKIILIPGPVELSDNVKESLTIPLTVPTDPVFIKSFQRVLQNTRKLFNSVNPKAQPYVISGSGTLGWDIVGSNAIQNGDKVLMLNVGYFSSSFTQALRLYGADVKEVVAAVGEPLSLEAVKEELSAADYKMVCITHVDTSTAVLSDVEGISQITRQISPNTLIVVDGVCSIGCEVMKFDDWGIDFCLTASQKAIGAPPGLSICMASERFIEKSFANECRAFFTSLKKWDPVMKAYESGNPAYFATLNITLINALDVALQEILTYPGGLEGRIEATKKTCVALHKILHDLGLTLVPKDANSTAHGVTVVYHDNPQAVIAFLNENGITITGGIHKDIKSTSFRIGHMGASACDPNKNHIQKCITLIGKFTDIQN